MENFMIRFLISNLFISAVIGILLAVKRLLRTVLSCRMQYQLWFLLLGLLAVPFLPVRPSGFLRFFSWLEGLSGTAAPSAGIPAEESAGGVLSGTAVWMDDFALSVTRRTPSVTGSLLFIIWLAGIFAMLIFAWKSQKRLNILEKSALPLQNQEVRKLYQSCLKEMNLSKNIPLYSTAYLKSPMIAGLLKPRIYLPIHLISDYCAADMRYMLLHELQHYKHRDALGNTLMNLAGIFYWFNPSVWYARKEMYTDREVACDAAVLDMLTEDAYEDYGMTLLNFAEKVSHLSFPFASGISSSMKQMKRRIAGIVSYEKPSAGKKIKGLTAFAITAVLLLCLTPLLSTYAAEENHYQWKPSETVSYVDASSYFRGYDGSFVLYDPENASWKIYNPENASLRVSPDSTYKIYDALLGLEEGIITPENSFQKWNGEPYPFKSWNGDQNLRSAMQASVNWYFQSIDAQLGASVVTDYFRKIGYGNEEISGDLSSYWMESSLKISPIEQVELLANLYDNNFSFSPENIHAVKDSLFLSSAENKRLYGKTGTGRVNGQDINGWFIGYVETSGHPAFFAVNIRGGNGATGSAASEIALSILSDWKIWK